MTTYVGFKKLVPEAKMPTRGTSGAAGHDVYAVLKRPLLVRPHGRVLVSTGLSLSIPAGYEIQVRPRSGLARDNGVTVLNSPGTIDEDYKGELKIILINHGVDDFYINPGDRIAQLVVSPVISSEFVEVPDVGESERSAAGFGSTGR